MGCVKTILDAASVEFVGTFIKQRFKTVNERAANMKLLILRITKGANRSTRQDVDAQLCAEIAKTFDFPRSGNLHQKIEKSRWMPYSASFLELFTWFFIRDTSTEDYLIAWGIFYTIKYSALMQPLLNQNLSTNEKSRNCTALIKIFHGEDSGLELVKAICAKIVAKSQEEAFSKYLNNIEKHWPIIDY